MVTRVLKNNKKRESNKAVAPSTAFFGALHGVYVTC